MFFAQHSAETEAKACTLGRFSQEILAREVLIGIGAFFIIYAFLNAFVVHTGWFYYTIPFLLAGVALFYVSKQHKGLLFVSFVFVWIGRASIIASVENMIDYMGWSRGGLWPVQSQFFTMMLTSLLTTLALYPFYRMPADRLMGPFFTIFLFSCLLFFAACYFEALVLHHILFYIFCALFFYVVSFLITPMKASQKESLLPLSYAALGGLSLFSFFVSLRRLSGEQDYWAIEEYGLRAFSLLAFLYVIYDFSKSFEKAHLKQIVLGMLLACIFGFLLPPITVFALLLITVGYAYQRGIVLIWGAALALISLFFIFRDAQFSPLLKVATLVGGGFFLLFLGASNKIKKRGQP